MTRSLLAAPAVLTPLFLAGAAAFSFADVLTVDDDGPADFSDLQAALDAADPGDVLLLAPGNYFGQNSAPYELRDKGVSIFAVGDERPVIRAGLNVVDVPVGQRFAMRGLLFELATGIPSLRFSDCEGVLWIEDTVVTNTGFALFGPGGALVSLDGCSSTVIASCSLRAEFVPPSLVVGNNLELRSSELFLFDTELSSAPTDAGLMRPALRASDSTVVIQGGSVTGIPLIPTVFGPCSPSGGAAIQLLDVESSLTAYGAELQGGPIEDPLACPDSVPGPVLQGPGTLTQVEVQGPRALEVPALITAGAPFELRVTGEPGDAVVAAVFQTEGGLDLPASLGALVAPLGTIPMALGTVAGDGALTVTLTPTGLPAGSPGLRFFAQAQLMGVSGTRLTTPSHALLRASD